MNIALLLIIYVAFISLGLPDGLIGSAWPAIQQDTGARLELGGVIAVTVTLMTILSSLATTTLVRKLGVGLLLSLSTMLTVGALVGFSFATSSLWLILASIPLGLGAGAIDAALNNYVANHYKAHHMNWLHAFWGFGATLGPIIFAAAIVTTADWHDGFSGLGVIQGVVLVILVASLPLWYRARGNRTASRRRTATHDIPFLTLLKHRTVLFSTIAFFFYVGIEVGVGLWLASYLVAIQSFTIEAAAILAGVYYAAITIGRATMGFVSSKISSTRSIRLGICISLGGIILLGMHISPVMSAIGVALIGLGFAPVYPGLIHETPRRFGEVKSARVMSLQMVGGYIGASIIPLLIGVAVGAISLDIFIYIIGAVILLLLVCTEYVNRRLRGSTSYRLRSFFRR